MKKIRVSVKDNKDFENQTEAREYAIKLLQAGCVFVSIDEIETKN